MTSRSAPDGAPTRQGKEAPDALPHSPLDRDGLVERKPWPLIGYAPGNYFALCIVCGETFDGDKRAYNCLSCAAIRANELIGQARSALSASGGKSDG